MTDAPLSDEPDTNTAINAYSAAAPLDSKASESNPKVPKPRVWTVFSAVLLAFMLAVVSQMVVAVVLLLGSIGDGVDVRQAAQGLVEKLMTPPAFLALLVLSQLMMGLSPIAWALRSPVPFCQRLGLVKPRCPNWALAVFPLGSIAPLAVSVAAAYGMTYFFTPDESIRVFYEGLTTAWAIPFIILIGLLPGFMEELLFRGYVQRRLIERWGPLIGISISTLLFGLFHVTPHAIALALVMGAWLGVLAWRTGSVWPGIICHAFVNSSWNVWQVGQRLWGLPETLPPLALIMLGTVAIALFGFSLWLIFRGHVPDNQAMQTD